MNPIEPIRRGVARGADGATTPVGPIPQFVSMVYASVDRAAARDLDRLRREQGVVSSCRRGCSHCCRYHILTNIAEAANLAHYIRCTFAAQEIEALRERTRRWHDWDRLRRAAAPLVGTVPRDSPEHDRLCCPLLVDGECSAYPARPVVCRVHYVSSNPEACLAAGDPDSAAVPPVVLTAVEAATRPFSAPIRARIEDEGLEFTRSIMLLPHWLAIQMGWDFALDD